MCIKTKELKFVDMKNYLAAGASYDQFLKAYGVQVKKFFFPYEFLDSLEKLDYFSLPRTRHFILLSKIQTFPTKSTLCANVLEKSKR